MRFNKMLKIIVAFLFCGPLHAINKLYIGLNTGRSVAHIELERNFINLLTDNSNMGQDTINAGAFIGYDYLITETPLFVGCEFFLQNHSLQSVKGENTFPSFVSYITHAKTNNSYGGVIKVGLVIRDLLIYGKGGIVMTNWTTSFLDKSDANIQTTISRKHNKIGAIFGFGMDYNLTTNWAIGIDHALTSYPSLVLTHKIGTFKFSPLLYTTNLRLIYKF